MTEGRRPRRVAETLRKHLAEAFSRELYDPRLSGLIVTRVDISGDLSGARIHVRSLVDSGDAAERLEVEKAANRAARTLRRGLGVRLGLKRTPDLRFFYDDGQDAVDRVEELLGEISRETPPRSE